MSRPVVLDIFKGAGGWSEGLRELGLSVSGVIGIETNDDACATARAAGHEVLQADVSMADLRIFADLAGLVGSPPCPSFSAAGKGLGKLDMARILAHIARIRTAGRWLHYSREGWHDPRSALVLEPLRYALVCKPEWIALEQVPPVLPIWQAIAEVLRDHGYHVDCGLLTAEQYGVAQTRKRAILAARRCLSWCPRRPSVCVRSRDLLPAPTHRKYRKGIARTDGDPSLLPWVSMADALGWAPRAWAIHSSGARAESLAAGTAVRVSVEEAGVLQSFRPDYPLAGQQNRPVPAGRQRHPAAPRARRSRPADWHRVAAHQPRGVPGGACGMTSLATYRSNASTSTSDTLPLVGSVATFAAAAAHSSSLARKFRSGVPLLTGDDLDLVVQPRPLAVVQLGDGVAVLEPGDGAGVPNAFPVGEDDPRPDPGSGVGVAAFLADLPLADGGLAGADGGGHGVSLVGVGTPYQPVYLHRKRSAELGCAA